MSIWLIMAGRDIRRENGVCSVLEVWKFGGFVGGLMRGQETFIREGASREDLWRCFVV